LNQFGLYYINTWKCHQKTSAIRNKQKCHFFFSVTKSENRRAEEDLPGRGWYQREGGGGGERAWEGDWRKYCVHRYVNRKMTPVEAISGMDGGEDKGE
jgi:hypothetical protein